MLITYSKQFLKSAKKLPRSVREKLAIQISRAADNPFHSLLHTKHLSGELTGFLSFRITRDWRVIFRFNNPDTIQLLRVVNRKNIYK